MKIVSLSHWLKVSGEPVWEMAFRNGHGGKSTARIYPRVPETLVDVPTTANSGLGGGGRAWVHVPIERVSGANYITFTATYGPEFNMPNGGFIDEALLLDESTITRHIVRCSLHGDEEEMPQWDKQYMRLG